MTRTSVLLTLFLLAGLAVPQTAEAAGGRAAGWGYNDFGQVGDGTTDQRSTPVGVQGISGGTAIAAGGWHSCVIVTGGAARCWGRNQDGQLGDGTTVQRATPVSVQGLSGATAIAGGNAHTCAVIGGGAARCWGWNYYGQLGNGSFASSTTPVDVQGLVGATSLTAGHHHSCALVTGGAVRCWGLNGHGQLGNDTLTLSPTPVDVQGISGAIAIAAGESHTCAIIGGTGAVRCWGYNGQGQLGNGTNSLSTTPVTVQGLTGAAAIAAGRYHSCAFTTSGAVRCWGSNEYGQLGNGNTSNSSTPVDAQGISGAAAITAGGDHSCAIIGGGPVRCWGFNAYGQLGNGLTTNSPTPVAVHDLAVARISAGNNHTLALEGEIAASLSATPSHLEFESAPGTASFEQRVVVSNTGSASAPIQQVVIEGADRDDFGSESDGCSNTTLAAGSSCFIDIRFSPRNPGTKSAIVSIPYSGFLRATASLSGIARRPSAGCDDPPRTQIVHGPVPVANVFTKLYVKQPDAQTVWVCYRVESANPAPYRGGRLEITPANFGEATPDDRCAGVPFYALDHAFTIQLDSEGQPKVCVFADGTGRSLVIDPSGGPRHIPDSD